MAIHTENPQENLRVGKKMNGWLALSPLLVFLLVYLVSSIVARDFYKVPVAAAFIIAGIVNGGALEVLIKAINICSECIGLG